MTAFHIITAFLIAVISGLGVGGGGLFATYLAIFTDIPQLSVQGFNLLFFIFCAFASVAVQIFRRKINMPAVALMVVTGLIGAYAGSLLTLILPEEYLRKLFGIMLVSGGLVSLRSSWKQKYSENRSTHDDSKIKNTQKSKPQDNEKRGTDK